jgi:DHA2 family methylenomycin A resistance protein-like MFS transporter
MSLVLLTLAYPQREERAHALGIWASCNGLAFIIGPTIGGWLLGSLGWRSIFYLALPFCAATVALAYYAIHESAQPEGRKLDLPGQALAIVGLGALSFAAIEGSHWGWTSPLILTIAAIGVAALALFVLVEARTPGPLLPLEFLSRPAFSTALAVAGLMTFGMYALLFIMPLYFQTVRGASPLVTGLELLPMSIAFVIVSQSVGYAANALGPRIVMTAGMALMDWARWRSPSSEPIPTSSSSKPRCSSSVSGSASMPRRSMASRWRPCRRRARAPLPACSTRRAWSALRSASPSSVRCSRALPVRRRQPVPVS